MYKVLIVDSDSRELNTISRIINRDSYGLQIVGMFSDAQEALDFLDTARADIMIANVRFPQMDSIALLQQLRRRRLEIRCILLASPADCGYVQKVVPLGIENFLLKPVDPQILLETLHNTVHKLQATGQESAYIQPQIPEHPAVPDRNYPPVLINQTFEKLMLNQEYRQCLAYLDNLFSDASLSSGITPSFLRNHIVELAVYVRNVLRSYNIDMTEIVGDDSAIFHKIIHFEDMQQLYIWMRDFLTASVEALESKNMRFSPCIARAVAHIEKNFAQDISLKTMAYELNINAAYLGQLFKAETGQLFSAYLNHTRMDNAKKLLLTTNLPLSEVSRQCGYTNISYFYNIFKKHTGQTPSQYRKAK